MDRQACYNQVMNTERSHVWDLARGILILLVFLAHVPYDDRLWKTVIFSFHMPAFFILSGILMTQSQSLQKPFPDYVRKKAYRLLLPVPLFELLAYGEVLLHWHGHFRFAEFLGKYAALDLWNHADWFLLSLFVSECLFYTVSRKKTLILPSGLGALTAAYLIRFVPLSRCLMSYFFLVCGYVLCRIFTEDSLPTAFISLVLFIGGNVLSTVRLDMHNAVYGNAVLMIPTAFAGTWLLFFLCRRLRSFLLLEAIGQHSMAIMGTHMPLLEIAHRLASSNKAVLLIAALLEIPTVLTARLIFPFLRGKGVHR